MEIYALKGYKVKVTAKTYNNGYNSDTKQISKYLKVDEIYKVDYTDVHQSSTDVFLQGFENIPFIKN